jgi:hypothetical protein
LIVFLTFIINMSNEGTSYIPPREQLSIFNSKFFHPCVVEYIEGPTGAMYTGATGSTGIASTGPTGQSITGPTGLSLTGPQGISYTGPTGESYTGPQGLSFTGATGESLTGPAGAVYTGSTGTSGVGGFSLLSSTVVAANTSNVSIDNVFSSSYSAYRVVLSNLIGSGSGVASLNMRLYGSNTVVNTGYYYANCFASSSGGPTRSTYNNGTEVRIGELYVGYYTGATIEIQNAFDTQTTTFQGASAFFNGGSSVWSPFACWHSANTSYSGINFFTPTNTFSCKVLVYGYNK